MSSVQTTGMCVKPAGGAAAPAGEEEYVNPTDTV
jgi:hypothetical protein